MLKVGETLQSVKRRVSIESLLTFSAFIYFFLHVLMYVAIASHSPSHICNLSHVCVSVFGLWGNAKLNVN